MGEKLTPLEFETLVERFYPDLTRRAVRLCKDHATAEDAVQNTLLFAFEKQKEGKFEKWDQEAYDIQFRAWLYKMLYNMIAYMFNRRSGAAKPNYQKYAYASFVYFNDRNIHSLSDFSGISDQNCNSETDYIMKAIDELPMYGKPDIHNRVVPSRYQEIAKMAFVDGLTAVEIGNLTNLAESTIRVRLCRIRKILQEKLAPVMQLADIPISKMGSCEFESHPEYQN